MENKTGQIFSGLPTWARGIIAVAVVGGVGFIGYKLWKKLNEGLKLDDADKTVEANKDEYDRLKNSGQTLSSPLPQYQALANKIKTSLDGCDSEDSEFEVANAVISLVKKPIDWYYLVRVFGSKMIEDCGWGETPYSLPVLLKEQLGQDVFDPTGAWNQDGFYYDGWDMVKKHLNKLGVTV